jgi:DNA processing protein
MIENKNYSAETICLSLTHLKGIGPKKGRKTLDAIHSTPTADEMASIASKFVGKSSSFSTDDVVKALATAEDEIERSAAIGIGTVAITSHSYPERLRAAEDAPLAFFFKGDCSLLHAPYTAAVIGTRHPTATAKESCRRITRTLVESNISIVSGLALGCDTIAHSECLNAGGKTIAILPCGLDDIYPSSNRDLAEAILTNGGCLLSEYPTGTKVRRELLVQRNRIQSGLSNAVVVIETSKKGGTMSTAKFCRKHNRILAVIDFRDFGRGLANDEGNRVLIKDEKTKLLRKKEDIIALIKSIHTPSLCTP